MAKSQDTAAGRTDALRLLLDRHGRTLLSLAASSIRHRLSTGAEAAIDLTALAPELGAPGAAFVTLASAGDLRGCIGSVQAWRPLAADVAGNAVAAAFEDPRFPPLSQVELSGLAISASVLTPPTPMTAGSDSELLAQLRPGIDGLILRDGRQQSVFLPQMWERAASPEQFVGWLKEKAGWPATYWSPTLCAFRFETMSVGADDLF